MVREVKRKVVLVGDPSVGKTSLIRRFVQDEFDDKYIQTIGAKVSKKIVVIAPTAGEVHVTLTIWDVVGAQGYVGVQARSFTGAAGALAVCDSTRPDTFRSLDKYWMPLLHQVTERVPVVFLANKADLGPIVPEEVFAALATKYMVPGSVLPPHLHPSYFSSAKTGEHVQDAFTALAYLIAGERTVDDEIRHHVETLVAMGLSQRVDVSTLKGVADAIIIDVVNGLPDMESALTLVRNEFTRAGVDTANPARDQLGRALEFLAEGEAMFLSEATVSKNLKRRKALLAAVG
jgi:small GTP-binding protein